MVMGDGDDDADVKMVGRRRTGGEEERKERGGPSLQTRTQQQDGLELAIEGTNRLGHIPKTKHKDPQNHF